MEAEVDLCFQVRSCLQQNKHQYKQKPNLSFQVYVILEMLSFSVRDDVLTLISLHPFSFLSFVYIKKEENPIKFNLISYPSCV